MINLQKNLIFHYIDYLKLNFFQKLNRLKNTKIIQLDFTKDSNFQIKNIHFNSNCKFGYNLLNYYSNHILEIILIFIIIHVYSSFAS